MAYQLMPVSGRCYPRKTLEALMRFCSDRSIHLVSDEIYALSVYCTDSEHVGFTSVLSIDTTGIIDSDYVHVMYGMAKVRSFLPLFFNSLIPKLCCRTLPAQVLGLDA